MTSNLSHNQYRHVKKVVTKILSRSLSETSESVTPKKLNGQLQMFQKQLEEYRNQVSMNETTSISNQHQLHNRIQQQDNAIHILVEEKAELIAKIKALDDSGRFLIQSIGLKLIWKSLLIQVHTSFFRTLVEASD